MTDSFALGPLTVTPDGSESVEGSTIAGHDETGEATRYRVTGPAGLDLVVRDTRWANGERDVVASDRLTSPQRYDQLVGRLRLGVEPHDGGIRLDLRQARTKPNGRVNLFNATASELARGARADVVGLLAEHGATVDTRRALLGDDSPSKERLALVARSGEDVLPVIAYVATRIAPAVHEVAATA